MLIENLLCLIDSDLLCRLYLAAGLQHAFTRQWTGLLAKRPCFKTVHVKLSTEQLYQSRVLQWIFGMESLIKLRILRVFLW